MSRLDHAVIRMKLEKLQQQLGQAPGSDVGLEQRISMLHAQMKMLVEILLHVDRKET